jgi:4'-phosphopantetheinyl transferase
LLPQPEQEPIVRKYHFQDACMSLGSALLKRAYLSKSTGLPWDEIKFDRKRDARLGKPCWLTPSAPPSDHGSSRVAWPTIDFNVSHQKGIVILVGVCQNSPVVSRFLPEIATDVVSPNERNDVGTIANSGLSDFISTFSDVLSEQEAFALTYTLPPGSSLTLLSMQQIPMSALGRLDRTTACGVKCEVKVDRETVAFDSDIIIEEKVRNFYAIFSLKEAFVKMGGEGLAATWIRECEFHGVRAPAKASVARCSLAGTFGETLSNGYSPEHQRSECESTQEDDDDGGFQITLDGEDVTDVAAEIQSFEEDYLLSTMLKPASLLGAGKFPGWERVSLERDIMSLARPQ